MSKTKIDVHRIYNLRLKSPINYLHFNAFAMLEFVAHFVCHVPRQINFQRNFKFDNLFMRVNLALLHQIYQIHR